jgi:hypothetical protein
MRHTLALRRLTKTHTGATNGSALSRIKKHNTSACKRLLYFLYGGFRDGADGLFEAADRHNRHASFSGEIISRPCWGEEISCRSTLFRSHYFLLSLEHF